MMIRGLSIRVTGPTTFQVKAAGAVLFGSSVVAGIGNVGLGNSLSLEAIELDSDGAHFRPGGADKPLPTLGPDEQPHVAAKRGIMSSSLLALARIRPVLVSASESLPDLPSGYSHKLRVGALRSDKAGHYRPSFQNGNEARLIPGLDGAAPALCPRIPGGQLRCR